MLCIPSETQSDTQCCQVGRAWLEKGDDNGYFPIWSLKQTSVFRVLVTCIFTSQRTSSITMKLFCELAPKIFLY